MEAMKTAFYVVVFLAAIPLAIITLILFCRLVMWISRFVAVVLVYWPAMLFRSYQAKRSARYWQSD